MYSHVYYANPRSMTRFNKEGKIEDNFINNGYTYVGPSSKWCATKGKRQSPTAEGTSAGESKKKSKRV